MKANEWVVGISPLPIRAGPPGILAPNWIYVTILRARLSSQFLCPPAYDGHNDIMTTSIQSPGGAGEGGQSVKSERTVPNQTISTLLNRRTIRAFTNEAIDPGTVAILEQAAQHAATSRYFNEWSAIRITDSDKARAIADMAHQDYVSQAPLLYIFLADQRRNADLARQGGVDIDADSFILNTGYAFLQSQNDAVLALHAMETAANSLGLGAVILGSVVNDVEGLIDLLDLPRLVYPVLGLAIGHPDQDPSMKPRMPRPAQIFINSYGQSDKPGEVDQALKDFDETVRLYYRDLRHMDAPRKAFSQIMADKSCSPKEGHEPMLPSIQAQGFDMSR